MNVERLAEVQCEEVAYEYEPTAQDLADAMEEPEVDRDALIDEYIREYERVYGSLPDLDSVLAMSNEEIRRAIDVDLYEEGIYQQCGWC